MKKTQTLRALPRDLLYLCNAVSEFKALPNFFEGDWNCIKLSESHEHKADIHCQLDDLSLLNEKHYHGIWYPQGINTFNERQLDKFLANILKLLRPEGFFAFSTPNIKELSRLVYQTSWTQAIPKLGLSPKELLFGTEAQTHSLNGRYSIKNGFSIKDIATKLEQAKFSRVEIIDQNLFFLVRAYHFKKEKGHKCEIAVQEYDINQQIAKRDQLDQSTNLPINYQKTS